MLSSLFLTDYKKWLCLAFFVLGPLRIPARCPLPIFPPAHSRSQRRRDMLSSLFLAGYKKIGFGFQSLFWGRCGSPRGSLFLFSRRNNRGAEGGETCSRHCF